eukprot:886925-Rhodomonas_salina.2
MLRGKYRTADPEQIRGCAACVEVKQRKATPTANPTPRGEMASRTGLLCIVKRQVEFCEGSMHNCAKTRTSTMQCKLLAAGFREGRRGGSSRLASQCEYHYPYRASTRTITSISSISRSSR